MTNNEEQTQAVVAKADKKVLGIRRNDTQVGSRNVEKALR